MSSLQRQLAAVAASSTHQLDLRAQKLAHGKSLLFEPRVAASQSFENVYLICYEGYQELCALDPRFVQFSRSLFSEQSKVEDRTQMTQRENEKLNEVLEAFITMVGPRLLLKPAEKALEWLVRRFRYVELQTEEMNANAPQCTRAQHRVPGADLPSLPQFATVPRPAVDTPTEPETCAALSPPIHPVSHESTAADHHIHRSKYSGLFQRPAKLCGQGARS
jgi:U3 small nucleolar RNA-associated protein 10